MNKQDSLAFLQGCIEKVKRRQGQDNQFYKEVYSREYVSKENRSFSRECTNGV